MSPVAEGQAEDFPLSYILHLLSYQLHLLQVLKDRLVECGFLFQLFLELGFEGGESFVEVEIVLVVGKSHIAAGGEDIVELLTRSILAELQKPFTSSYFPSTLRHS